MIISRRIVGGLIVGPVLCVQAVLAAPPTSPGPRYSPDRIIMKPRATLGPARAAEVQAAHRRLGGKVYRQYPRLRGLQVVKLPPGLSVKRALEKYRSTGLFEYVSPDYEVSIAAVPNDPQFTDGTLWGLNNTGQNGGTPDADIDAPEAWDIRTDASSVIVAVIDTGVRYTHTDLATNIWTNPGEIAGNGIDDDGNGYVDDIHGINAITGSGDPMDDNGHGTHCSGTIGAVGNNGIGVAGVAWRVKLMGCKFLGSGGSGLTSDAIECIDYAISKGAKVMSNSWGCPGCFEQPLLDAIAAARDAGVIFVAAAGNSAANVDVLPFYPAAYDVDNVVAVAATDRNDALAGFSNYGNEQVDLGAPGVSITSTYANNDTAYTSLQGTSMACPHVAGAVALLRAQFPADNYTQLISRLLGTTDQIPSLAGNTLTGGRLNIHKALTQTPRLLPNFTATPIGGSPPLSVTFSNTSIGSVTNLSWNFGDGSPASTSPVATHTYTSNGTYFCTLTITGPGGTANKTRSITVQPNYTKQSTVFNWINPTSMTPLILGDDDFSGAQAIPFTFTFYGQPKTQLFVSSNGLLSFDTAGLSAYELIFLNRDMPDPTAPNDIIAPLWDDLDPSAGGSIYIGTVGTAPNRIFVVSWVDVPHWATSTTYSFQALLYEGSNDITFQYLNISPADTEFGAGRAATVGVENNNGAVACRHLYNGSTLLANNQAIRFLAPGTPPSPPAEPLPYYALALATNRIDIAWNTVAGATGYIIRRDGVPIATTSTTAFLDLGLNPDSRYCYSVTATNSAGTSPVSEEVCATTLSVPVYNLNGTVDYAGYLQVSGGMTLYAAVHGQTLYVATRSPGTNGPNDHFIFVSDQIQPTAIVAAPWAKSGLIAAQPTKPYLGGESQNDFVGWFIDDNAPNDFQLAAKSPTNAGQMEGTLDLITTFGYLPPTIYIAAAAYPTGDGGMLVAQAPAGNGDANIDSNEFLALPTVAITDRNLDGLYDRLDPAIDFVMTSVQPNPVYGGFDIVWNCVPGKTYQLQYCAALSSSTWTDLGGPRTAAAGQISMSATDPGAGATSRRFYRVKLVP